MSEQALISKSNLPAGKYSNDKAFESVAKSSAWLPRLQLFSAANSICKQGKFPLNHYGLVEGKDRILDLTKQVDILPISWRPKAMKIAGSDVISKFNPNDAEFTKIQDQSEIANSGCMYGPEFLVYVPSIKKFSTFFMCSKSARRESPNLKEKLDNGIAATLDSTYIEGKKFSWQAPIVKGCSTPFDLPPEEAILEQVTIFNNPPETEVEVVTEADRDR